METVGARRRKLGFLVNPIAGMGGAVGLKGTDGLVEEALALGARPTSHERARGTLMQLASRGLAALVLAAGGEMGEGLLREEGLEHVVVYQPAPRSTAEDTRAACLAFLREGVDMILFCGGDGTARDVSSVVGSVPMLGIPAGVKMHSGVFAVSPEAAADLALGFLEDSLRTRETEVVDVDEDAYRHGRLETRLYGTARTPHAPAMVQERKQVYASGDEEEHKREIALFAGEFMRDGSAYILGAGTTTAAIAKLLGVQKTLLGVDVIRDGEILLRDASERDLLDLLDSLEGAGVGAKIIVSPIGAQGFVLGRGSQQISAEVLRRVGVENLIVVATPHKLWETKHLLVDTGDAELDRAISGRRQVVVGYRLAQLKEVKAAGSLFYETSTS